MLFQVLVTRKIAEDQISVLQKYAEVEIISEGNGHSRQELLLRLRGKHALLCTITDQIDADLLDTCPKLRIISNYGVGINNIDIEAASKRHILVTNTPGVLTDATADLTWALLLDVARRVTEGDRLVRNQGWKGWKPTFHLGTEVTGKTLGIIGMGRIGQAVARRASGFRMRVLYHSRTRLPEVVEQGLNLQYLEREELLQQADFISLHAPYTRETYHLIGEKEFSMMKASAFLINTARGNLVEEKALIKAIAQGKIAGAGLDVYEHEPDVPHELIEMKQVVLSPHLGSATKEARAAMSELAVNNLVTYFKGEKPLHLVNEEVWN